MSLKPPRQGSLKLPSIEAKVVVLGTQGVGKTSLVLRHVGNTFSRSVSPTIGASFFTFSMTVNGYRIKLQLWDTAGQERFRSMAPMYYRRANAAMIVYDITREKSFDEAQEWVKELESKVDNKNLALCIVGNKCDLADEREVTREKGEDFAHELGAMFTETSAAENVGVKEAFLKIAQSVITLFQQNQLTGNDTVDMSCSPVNSYSRSPLPVTFQAKKGARYHHTASGESNGRVVVTDKRSSLARQNSGTMMQKCCS